tara:strand:- start:205 stop:306 length:102 start_codon:yes stop_codon:yes gene_type:complete
MGPSGEDVASGTLQIDEGREVSLFDPFFTALQQ